MLDFVRVEGSKIGKIAFICRTRVTPSQFSYWSKSGNIGEPLDPSQEYDHTGLGTPKAAIIKGNYWDQNETLDFSGLSLDSDTAVLVSIKNAEGKEILFESIEDFEERHQADDEFYTCKEETEEFYFGNDVPKGKYLWWNRQGQGLWFTGDIILPFNEVFNETELSFLTVDFEGESFIHGVSYKGVQISNDYYQQSWGNPSFSFFQSDNGSIEKRKIVISLY